MIRHKKVELTELFYDLVYVYVISQITHILSHFHHGNLILENVIVFSIALIIFINSWMVQMVFTNRFGKNSATNTSFMLLQMISLLIAANTLSTDLQGMIIPFFSSLTFLTSLLLLQYGIEYSSVTKAADKYFIKRFFYILGIRILSLLPCLFLPYRLSLVIAVLGILVTWLLPSLLLNPDKTVALRGLTPIHFSHLIERLSLLVIITFGEMIVGIVPYFSTELLSFYSLFPFLTVSNLFLFYIKEIDSLIDVDKTDVSGNGAIYYHYFIFFGLSFVTAAFTLLREQNGVNNLVISILYAGILLFLIGVLLHAPYHKAGYRWGRTFYGIELLLPVMGLLMSIGLGGSLTSVTLIACLVTSAMTCMIIRFR